MITLFYCIHARYCYCVWCGDETANEWGEKKNFENLSLVFENCSLPDPAIDGVTRWHEVTRILPVLRSYGKVAGLCQTREGGGGVSFPF